MTDLVPNVIAVLGAARSGSSCTAGILHTLGVSMGINMLPPNEMNPKGFFEAVGLRRMLAFTFRMVQDEGLKKLLSSDEIISNLKRHVNERMQRGSRSPLGVKHPWLCLLIPEMVEAWPGLKAVSINRDINAVVASMEATGQFPGGKQNQRCNQVEKLIAKRDADLQQAGIPTLKLNYADVLKDSAKTVRDLVEFLGIMPTNEQIAEAVSFVDPTLCHNG